MKNNTDIQLENRKLWEEFWKDRESPPAFLALVECWMPLTSQVLDRVRIRLPRNVQPEDLLQCAVMGLFDAIEKFNTSESSNFQSFAIPRIRGAILDELRSYDHLSRSDRLRFKKIEQTIQDWTVTYGKPPDEEELAGTLAMSTQEVSTLLEKAHPWLSLDSPMSNSDGGQEASLLDILADTSRPSPDEAAHKQDLLKIFRSGFGKLAPREQKILYLYYFEELRLAEIARVFDLTEARICQLHMLAIMKLRAVMQSKVPELLNAG